MLRAPLDPARLRRALEHVLRPPLTGRLQVAPLSGGYSWTTLAVTDEDGRRVIVRVAPAGGTMEPYDPTVEATALRAARGAVPAPEVLAVGADAGLLGAPFAVQTAVPGVVRRLSEVTDPADRRRYRAAFARTLGTLHRHADASALSDATDVTAALDEELQRTVETYRRAAACRHPGFEIGLRWLYHHRPVVADRPALCHGDYRFHNLAWTAPGRIGGVLDWERAWCGDPMADVAFTQLFSGWCAVDGDVVERYEDAGGGRVVRGRVAYGRRFERVRSHTSGMRALAALGQGRSDREELFGIGEAGEAGMWSLVAWLEEGALDPLPVAAPPDGGYRPAITSERLAALRRRADDPRLRAHLDGLAAADAAARDAALGALGDVTAPAELRPALSRALAGPDREQAWRRAYAVLAPAAAHAGAELVPALSALGLRFTSRPTFLRPKAAA